ncbi:MAG: disulfide bond formation protein DsbA [Chthoniobacterales bacterium]|nr:MAG: disulfide bond formation protein DsbA [Chthoniobacterales bacterium]
MTAVSFSRVFGNAEGVQVSVTNYLDVVSSWCFWAEPTWAELKRRYSERVRLDWKIALMDAAGLPKSRAQGEWFYRRSGVMNRAPFMLRSDWYEPVLSEYLAPNLVAEAARALGVTDDRARLALANATLREGAPRIREIEVAAAIVAQACGINEQQLVELARSAETEKRVRASTAEWQSLRVTQRPTLVVDTEIGDRAVFSGVVKLEPIAATIDSMLEDADFYASHKAHFGDPPSR